MQGRLILLLFSLFVQPIYAADQLDLTSLQESLPQESIKYRTKGEDLFSKSVYLFAGEVLTFYGFTKLPEDWTKWRHEDVKPKYWARNWRHNASRRPIHDPDSFIVNFVGHPVSGMGYYVMARQTGYGYGGSFLYTALQSTIWEYGIEAMAERTSWQDLLSTPTIGSLLGELSYQGVQHIEANNGTLYGSPVLGGAALFALSPFNSIIVWTRDLLEGRTSKQKLNSFSTWSVQPVQSENGVSGRHHGQQVVLSWAMQF